MKVERSRRIIRLKRKALEKGHVKGRIVGTSPKLVAVAVVGPVVRVDGFNVFRRTDISKLVVDPYAKFVGEALRLGGDKFPRVRPTLASWRALVGWASLLCPLATIHIEKQSPQVCYIGVPTRMTSKALTLVSRRRKR